MQATHHYPASEDPTSTLAQLLFTSYLSESSPAADVPDERREEDHSSCQCHRRQMREVLFERWHPGQEASTSRIQAMRLEPKHAPIYAAVLLLLLLLLVNVVSVSCLLILPLSHVAT